MNSQKSILVLALFCLAGSVAAQPSEFGDRFSEISFQAWIWIALMLVGGTLLNVFRSVDASLWSLSYLRRTVGVCFSAGLFVIFATEFYIAKQSPWGPLEPIPQMLAIVLATAYPEYVFFFAREAIKKYTGRNLSDAKGIAP